MKRRDSAARRPLGVVRDDSDDELGIDDLPWEWICEASTPAATSEQSEVSRKRKHVSQQRIVGARMGNFECQLGDCVLLKAEGGSNEAWVGIINEFLDEDEDGQKAANFLWFSTEKEIRNNNKKRADFLRASKLQPTVKTLALTDLTFLERIVHHPLIRYQSLSIHQRQSKRHVSSALR